MGNRRDSFDDVMRLGDIPDVVSPRDYGLEGEDRAPSLPPPPVTTDPGTPKAKRERGEQDDPRALDRRCGLTRYDLLVAVVATAAMDLLIHVLCR